MFHIIFTCSKRTLLTKIVFSCRAICLAKNVNRIPTWVGWNINWYKICTLCINKRIVKNMCLKGRKSVSNGIHSQINAQYFYLMCCSLMHLLARRVFWKDLHVIYEQVGLVPMTMSGETVHFLTQQKLSKILIVVNVKF